MGISSIIAAVADAVTSAVGATAASALGDAAIGAGLGAATSGLTGGNPLTGALEGGFTGGAIGGLGPEVGAVTGAGPELADALAGAAGGALGSGIAGKNALTGALSGGVSGGISGALSDVSAPSISSGSAGASAPIGSAGGGPIGGTVSAPVSVSAPSSDFLDTSGSISNTGILPTGSGGSSSLTQPFGSFSAPSGTGTSLPTSSSVSDFLSGSSGSSTPGAANIGQGPTVANAAAANAAGAAAPAGNSITNAFSNPTTSNILDALGKNSNILVPSAGLAYQAIAGSPTPKGYNQLLTEANNLNNQGSQLQSYLASGTLPPGLQASLDQASASAKASIRSQYAARGMSGSSAEAQDLANVDTQMQAQGASLAMNLLQQGVNETQLSSQLYDQIMQQQMASDNSLGSAIANFATAAAGGGGTTNLKITSG